MRELQFVADRLEDIGKELVISHYSGFLEESHRKIKKITASDLFPIDLYIHSLSSSRARTLISQLTASCDTSYYQPQVRTENGDTIRIFEQVFPAVAILAYDEVVYNDPSIREKLKNSTGQYKVIIIINFFKDPSFCRELITELGPQAKLFLAQAEDCMDRTMDNLFRTLIPEDLQRERLRKIAYINSVKPVIELLGDIFSSENKAVQTRRLLNSSNILITKKEEQVLNISDFSSALRQFLQKNITETEKTFKLKYDELSKPNTGMFSRVSHEQAHALTDFVREDMAEKTEKVAVTVKKEFQDELIANINGIVQEELEKDETSIRTAITELLGTVNTRLQEKGIQPIRKEEIDLPFPEKDRVTRSYCYMSKQFNGEIIKKGVAEYFVALRDYIGVIMVATGLLAPLNMIASLQDEHSFLKRMNIGIKYTTAGISLLLIVYGIYDLRSRIPKKRKEEFIREMNKARELLYTESRRMFNECSRDWMTSVSTWLRDVFQNINNQVDKNLRDMQTARAAQLQREKTQQQRLQQSIELIQKNIGAAERIKDQLSGKLKDIILETEKDLKFK